MKSQSKVIDTSVIFTQCYKFLFLWAVLLYGPLLLSQEVSYGDMRIFNFDQKTFKGGPQTWDIEVARDGNVYFSNNNGLIQFDGIDFNIYELPNHTIVRSIMESSDGTIYAGGQNEFGYFKPSNNGLQYHSLSKDLPDEEQDFTDVWNIHQLGESIIFQSSNYIFIWEESSLSVVKGPEFPISASNIINHQLVLADEGGNVFLLEKESLKKVISADQYESLIIRHIDGNLDSLLLFTLKQSILIYSDGELSTWKENQNLTFLEEATIYSVRKSEQGFVVATSRDGIYHISKSGDVLKHISVNDGLQNDNVLAIGIDSFGNYWVGLNRGIDFVANSAPYRFLVPDGSLQGTGYTAATHNGKLYLGTNNGLYVNDNYRSSPLESNQFIAVKNTEGQAWSLNEISGNLYLSHHEGLFRIEDDRAIKVSKGTGSWLVEKVPNKPFVIEGTYYGINKYELINDRLVFRKKISGEFSESSRLVAIDEDHIWIAHPYRGLFMLRMDDDWNNVLELTKFGQSRGFSSDLNIHVFKVFDETVFTDESGIYRYDKASERFVRHEEYAQYFDSTSFVRYLSSTNDGNIWYATQNEIGYLDIDEKSLSKSIEKMVVPALPVPLTGGFENIYTIEDKVIFASEVGFVILPFQKLNTYLSYKPKPRVITMKAMGKADSNLIFSGFHSSDQAFELPSSYSGVMFQVSSMNYALKPTMQYQFKLDGYDDEWSEWSTENSKMYNLLTEGDYTFQIRSKLMNKVSDPVKISFSIAPPWYRTTGAIVTFSLVFLGLLGFMFLLPSLRYRKEKEALKQEQAKEIRKKEEAFQSRFKETEKKIDKLENEKLEVEINSKNQQLASTTMHLVQKGEFLLKMKEELGNIKKKTEKTDVKKHINKLIRTIENDSQIDDNWESFEMAFDQVHVNFTKRLKEKYPQLTPNDIKLCTYLKLNLSSKEIASLTNISVRGVEISRYRLRKKLELESSENLVEFIQSI